VDLHRQSRGGGIGDEVGFGSVELSHVGSGFVLMMFSETFTNGVGHGGLGTVGNDFDRVDEVLASVRELEELVFLGKFLDLDMPGVLLALRLELIDFARFKFDHSVECFGVGHVPFDLRGREAASEGEVTEPDLLARELGNPFTNLSVEGSPSGVYDLYGIFNRFDLIVYKSIQTKMFPSVFEEVLLIPSSELRPIRC